MTYMLLTNDFSSISIAYFYYGKRDGDILVPVFPTIFLSLKHTMEKEKPPALTDKAIL